MEPKKFDACNSIFGKDQGEYLNLPAHQAPDGTVTIWWRLSFWERVAVALTGNLFHKVETFNKPFQPVRLTTMKPFICLPYKDLV